MKKQGPTIKREVEFYTKKIIKKYGNSLVIPLNPDEQAILGVKAGDIIGFRIQHVEFKAGGKK